MGATIRLLIVLLTIALPPAGGALTSCGAQAGRGSVRPGPDTTVVTRSGMAPDPKLEAAIFEFSPDYDRETVELLGSGARYAYERVDLNGDGRDEVLAYLMGPFFCGTGGCETMLFSEVDDGYGLVNSFPITQLPFIASTESSEGWKNLVKREAGGGAQPTWVVYAYDGTRYVERERMPGDAEPDGTKLLGEGSALGDGIPLEPTN